MSSSIDKLQLMNVTTRQLQAFVLVARHASFSRAAEQMFITQPALSLLVRELETRLGFRLFERTTRRVALTEYGAEFLTVANHNMQELKQAVLRIGQSAFRANRTLAIGAPPMTAANLLPEAVVAFSAAHPDVQVKLYDIALPGICERILSGHLDIGFGMFIKPTRDIRRTALFRFSLVVVRSGSLGEATSNRRWAELANLHLVGLPPDNPLQQLVDKRLFRVGHRRPPRFVVNYLETQVAMVEAGAGIAILPSSAVSACLHRKIAVEPLIDPVVDLDFYHVSNRGTQMSPIARQFICYLQHRVATGRTQGAKGPGASMGLDSGNPIR